MKRPRLYGHRGCSSEYPENTLTSFAACLDYKIDGIELDVQLSKDGKLVVFHDDTLKRIANRNEKISSLDYAVLKDIDIGQGQRIPLLEEVFALCKTDILYDIEIKAKDTQDHQLEQKLLETIRRFDVSDCTMASSFNPISLMRFKRLCKGTIKTALIYSNDASVPKMLRKGFGRHVVHPHYLKPEACQAKKALAYRYPVIAWTVDTLQEAEQLLSLGVQGLISNKPQLLKPLFNYGTCTNSADN